MIDITANSDPIRIRLLELALKGQIYDGAGKEIAKLSVAALDSILLLADEAIHEMDIVNQIIPKMDMKVS